MPFSRSDRADSRALIAPFHVIILAQKAPNDTDTFRSRKSKASRPSYRCRLNEEVVDMIFGGRRVHCKKVVIGYLNDSTIVFSICQFYLTYREEEHTSLLRGIVRPVTIDSIL